jgi:hypothetical protein
MGVFFIDTGTGQVATLRQLVEAGVATEGSSPPPPWHRIQGSRDASTLWYAVLRKKVERKSDRSGGSVRPAEDFGYVYIGALAIRHQPHHASMLEHGWDEVAVGEIGVPEADTTGDSRDQMM